jgi:hypothetical protein
MLKAYWITNKNGEYGRIIAENLDKADRILFLGVLAGKFPVDCFCIEEISRESSEDISIDVDEEEVSDDDIISIEEDK